MTVRLYLSKPQCLQRVRLHPYRKQERGQDHRLPGRHGRLCLHERSLLPVLHRPLPGPQRRRRQDPPEGRVGGD